MRDDPLLLSCWGSTKAMDYLNWDAIAGTNLTLADPASLSLVLGTHDASIAVKNSASSKVLFFSTDDAGNVRMPRMEA